MDVSSFKDYIRKSQDKSFYGSSKKEFVNNVSNDLYDIRKGLAVMLNARRAINDEKQKIKPNLSKIRAIEPDAIARATPSFEAMEKLNRQSEKETGNKIFDIGPSFTTSRKTRLEFVLNAYDYREDLKKRITQNPSRFIPRDKENTQYEDRLYVESFLREDMIRERVRELPENSNKEYRISSFEELNKIIRQRKEEEPQHTQHMRHKGTNFER